MSDNSCFFIGHADAPSSIVPSLEKAIERHIVHLGVHEFFFGSHGNYDWLVLHALLRMKAQYPFIRLILVAPYHPALHNIQIPDGIDELYYPFDKPVPPRYAIARANQSMIRACSHLIAYVCHTGKSRD